MRRCLPREGADEDLCGTFVERRSRPQWCQLLLRRRLRQSVQSLSPHRLAEVSQGLEGRRGMLLRGRLEGWKCGSVFGVGDAGGRI